MIISLTKRDDFFKSSLNDFFVDWIDSFIWNLSILRVKLIRIKVLKEM